MSLKLNDNFFLFNVNYTEVNDRFDSTHISILWHIIK